MKYTFIIFGLFLVAVSAGPTAKSNGNLDAKKVNNILQKLTQISNKAATTLKENFNNNYSFRFMQFEDFLSDIAFLRKLNKTCVAAKEQKFNQTLDTLFDNIKKCESKFTDSSANIMVKIGTQGSQVIFGGLDVLRLIKTCNLCRNPIMKNSCYERLTTKRNLYLKDARKSIRAVDKIATDRVSEAVDNFSICITAGVTDPVWEVYDVYKSIKACIEEE